MHIIDKINRGLPEISFFLGTKVEISLKEKEAYICSDSMDPKKIDRKTPKISLT